MTQSQQLLFIYTCFGKTYSKVVTLTIYSTRKNPTAMLSMKPITSTAFGTGFPRFQVSLPIFICLIKLSVSFQVCMLVIVIKV